ncbi:hypothetical protein, variant 3 [Aphanomyces invadans]|uniref:Calcium-activated potassium channel BK alpha subunit domain-containing protein n=1 Tax=Aphanomyces invadans TaxID=157072 RepID=A0A024UJA5_9STRA|nr:hypothetical protein, variant 3 [Aphanomyces invadans]XP_008865685.1 hypothetical protein, variant 2 [Aphanomyces invadans]ETW05907.1 hypothetical protein, variant 2 [Aphanomyces invadans]ETW05908.1 hypothetical protein, variant 3 [Aphanomyces invadans]|eukprot:XP_008865684.1 hypothetical protein, variant 3 [Aphanomyces invadans]
MPASAKSVLQDGKRRYGKTFRGSFNTYKVKVDDPLVLDPRATTSLLLPRQNGETFQLWVARNLELSPLMRAADALMVVLSFVMVAFFLYTNWSTYSIDLEPSVQSASNVIGILFTADYIVRVYAAPLRLEYITSVFSLVDLIGVASAWIEISFTQHTLTMLKLDTAGRQFLSMLQVMKSMRVLRAYRLLRFTSSIVQRQILATVLTVLCMIIAVAGALQNVELCPAQCPDFCIPHYRDDVLTCSEIEITFPNTNLTTWCTSFVNYTLASPHPPTNCCRCQVYRFLDWIYFVVVTISTLGYGDISPKTSAGRIGTSILIMMTFVFLPIQVNTLVSVISQHSKYNKAFTSRSDTHGVITAHELDVGMLHAFLRQFFHPQNRNWNERIVILHPQEPTPDVTKIIHQFEPRVTYIVGSAMQESDLKRAAVPTSSVCYVLTSASGDKTGRADQMSAILTTAFRVMNKTVPIFTQVIASTSVSYCTISGANNVVCVQKLKMSMLALSCRIKGLTTLLTNLLSTLAPPLKPPKDAWMTDYLEGAMSKIFRVDIPRSFSGITYHELVMFLYNNLQVIPIAMETGTNSIQLNPMSFKLGQAADPKLCCTVYVIAPGVEVVDRINEYQLEQIRQFRQTLRKMERAKADAEDSDRVKPVQSPKRQTKKLTLGGHMFKSKTDDVAGSDLKVAYDQFMAKEVPSVLSRHIVIVGLPYELQDLLGPLRAKSTSQIVVIFAPTKMSIADFERLTHPDRTYFALGSPLSSFDLQRVSITSAASVIVLSTSGTCNSPSTVEFFDKNMVDADAITCVRFILEGCSRHHKHPPNLIVDLAKHTNVRFLSMAVKRESRRDRRVTDHQPGVDDGAYSDMEFATNESDDVLDMNHICEPAYASVNGLIESLMSECYQKPTLPVIIDALLHGQEPDNDLQLFQVPCPKGLVGKMFGESFRKLLRHNLICIGCWHPEVVASNASKVTPAYVHTNPKTEMKLHAKDLLYVIGRPTSHIDL